MDCSLFTLPVAVTLSGTVTAGIDESAIVAGGKTIILTVQGDSFVAADVPDTPAFNTGATQGSTGADIAGRGGGARTDNGDFTCSWPTSYTPTAGHFALLLVYNDQGAVTTPAGWTPVTGSPFGSAGPTLCIFTLVLVGGDTEPTMTVSGSTVGASHLAQMAIYTGVGGVGAVGTSSDGTGTPMTAAGLTTTEDNSIVCACCGRGDNESSGSQTFNGDATGVTERLDGGTASGNDSQISMADKTYPTAGTATGSSSSTTLTVDPWVAVNIELIPSVTTGPFNAARQDIIDGLDSAQSEATGWDAEVKANLPVTAVVRTSDTVCTITLTAQSSYDITAQETVTATVPASALVGGSPLVASPTFTVASSSSASTASNPLGWEGIYPWLSPKWRTQPGLGEWTLFKPPAATAQNPTGWEGIHPWLSPKWRTQPGLGEWTLFKPPAATAQNPAGWEGIHPWLSPKWRTQAGSTEWTLFKPPAATAGNPLGWEGIQPWRMPRYPVPAGLGEYTLFAPPASTARNPTGWESTHPWFVRKVTGPSASWDWPNAIPGAATARNPLGWPAVAPFWALRRLAPGPYFDEVPRKQPPPPPTLLPAGWESNAPWKTPRWPTQPGGYAETLRALPQPIAPGAGFEGVSPFAGKRRWLTGGYFELSFPRAVTQLTSAGVTTSFPSTLSRQRPATSWSELPFVRREFFTGFTSLSPAEYRSLSRPVGYSELIIPRRELFAGFASFSPAEYHAPVRTADWSELTFKPSAVSPVSALALVYPERSSRPVAPTASFDWQLRLVVVSYPDGWWTQAPTHALLRHVQEGLATLPLRALPQPLAPNGWWTLAPVRAPWCRTQAGMATLDLRELPLVPPDNQLMDIFAVPIFPESFACLF